MSKKAVFSTLLSIFVAFGFLGGFTDGSLVDSELQVGLLFFECIAFALGLSGFLDARKNKISGKPLAVMSFVVSTALVLSSLILFGVALHRGN